MSFLFQDDVKLKQSEVVFVKHVRVGSAAYLAGNIHNIFDHVFSRLSPNIELLFDIKNVNLGQNLLYFWLYPICFKC